MRRLARATALCLALLVAGACSAPLPAVVDEFGDALARTRTALARRLEPGSHGAYRSLAMSTQLWNLRQAILDLPSSLRLGHSYLPHPGDLERLVEPPSVGWQPAPLSTRVVSRLRF